MIKFDPQPHGRLSKQIIEAQAAHEDKRLRRGWVGIIFGLGEEKAGNIAGSVLLVLIVVFTLILLFATDAPSISKKDELTIVGGFITTTLGFLFGRTAANGRQD